jgi:hypothetical protein
MKRKLYIIITFFIMLIFVSCLCNDFPSSNYSDSSMPSSKESNSPTYKITRETGFYKSSTSEDYSETLKAGTIIRPANNASSLDCRTSDFEGISITSCWVEIVSSGRTGWVLKNALGN